jgi:hypothetical protein
VGETGAGLLVVGLARGAGAVGSGVEVAMEVAVEVAVEVAAEVKGLGGRDYGGREEGYVSEECFTSLNFGCFRSQYVGQ